jgi:hydroxypyruvate isomerase
MLHSNRRTFLKTSAGCIAGPIMGTPAMTTSTKLRLKHSVVGWCFQSHGKKWDTETLCQKAKAAGCSSVELVDPSDWPTLKKHGLACAIASAGTEGVFTRAWNNSAFHPELFDQSKAAIEKCGTQGVERVIAFVGMRWRDPSKPGINEIPRDEAAASCIKGWKELAKLGEKHKVTVCVEHLNSRVADHPMKGHPGYQGDDLDWVTGLIRQVDSPRLKLLFDVYHVQIMHGDILRRLEECKDVIGHIHTAGNPGRAELDNLQEIHYPAVGAKLHQMGYTGFVGHEFIPTRNPAAGISEAIQACEGF